MNGDRHVVRRETATAGVLADQVFALDRGGPLPTEHEAELLELLADECFLTARLDDAIRARRRALHMREQMGVAAAVSANHQALAIPEWNNGSRSAAEYHAAQAVAVLDGHVEPENMTELALFGHALTTQAYLAAMTRDFARAAALSSQARECAAKAGDPTLVARVAVTEGLRAALAGEGAGREAMLFVLKSLPEHFDEIYSFGCVHLAHVEIELRRLDRAAEVLDISVPLSVDRDVPLTWSYLITTRARLKLLVGDWDDALVDAEAVLNGPSPPLARTVAQLVRAVISLRRDRTGVDQIDQAWGFLRQYGQPLSSFPASAIGERSWLTETADDRLDECRALLESRPIKGLEWARGELAMWLHLVDPSIDAAGAGPNRLFLDGEFEAAADAFHRLSLPYEAALARVDSGNPDLARRGLDVLDRLGADAVATTQHKQSPCSVVSNDGARRRRVRCGLHVGATGHHDVA